MTQCLCLSWLVLYKLSQGSIVCNLGISGLIMSPTDIVGAGNGWYGTVFDADPDGWIVICWLLLGYGILACSHYFIVIALYLLKLWQSCLTSLALLFIRRGEVWRAFEDIFDIFHYYFEVWLLVWLSLAVGRARGVQIRVRGTRHVSISCL